MDEGNFTRLLRMAVGLKLCVSDIASKQIVGVLVDEFEPYADEPLIPEWVERAANETLEGWAQTVFLGVAYRLRTPEEVYHYLSTVNSF